MILRIDNVEISYKSFKALENVTFEVKSGEFLGVMGPNGSGKTTLLKCISNVLEPERGVVLIDGKDIQALSRREMAKRLGVVAQTQAMDFPFKVSEIVLMGRTPYINRLGSERAYDFKIAEDAMRLTDVLHVAEMPFDELSGGEKQRVIIARALAQEPQILLLDEPTVHLDIRSQFEILQLVRNLCKEKKIIVVGVFHDLNLASHCSDRLLLLYEGRIASQGTPEEVLTPHNIKEIYKVDAVITRHPLTNIFHITPSMPHRDEVQSNGRRIHVIGGGGSGSEMMGLLHEKGFEITAGVLNVLDSDYQTARMLKIPVIEEIPFSRITEESHMANLELIRNAHALVITDFPVGYGNLKNIEAGEVALDSGISVVIIDSSPDSRKDFIQGNLVEYFNELKKKGAHFVRNPKEALEVISKEASP